MSAMLDGSVADHVFENGTSLSGLTVREAIIATGSVVVSIRESGERGTP